MERVLAVSYSEQENVEEKVNDAHLWRLMLAGNRESFSNIFLKFNPILLTIGLKLGFERKMVEDCIQDLFVNIWQKKEGLSEVSSVKYYLVVSLRRALLHQKEKDTRYFVVKEELKLESPKHTSSDFCDNNDGESSELLMRNIDSLPKRQEQALKLRYMESKSYPEIASIMSVNEDSVRRFVSKAVKNLKKAFSIKK